MRLQIGLAEEGRQAGGGRRGSFGRAPSLHRGKMVAAHAGAATSLRTRPSAGELRCAITSSDAWQLELRQSTSSRQETAGRFMTW